VRQTQSEEKYMETMQNLFFPRPNLLHMSQYDPGWSLSDGILNCQVSFATAFYKNRALFQKRPAVSKRDVKLYGGSLVLPPHKHFI